MIYLAAGFSLNTALLQDLDTALSELILATTPPPENYQESIQRRLLKHRVRICAESKCGKEHQKTKFYSQWVVRICRKLDEFSKAGPIFTHANIRSLHKLLFAQGVRATCLSSSGQWYAETHSAGEWRKNQMWVTVNHVSYPYIATEDVSRAMDALFAWQSTTDGLSPLVKAVFCYFVFCEIHPFSDGNGTVALLLVDTWLRQLDIPVNWIAMFETWSPETQLSIFKSVRTGGYENVLQLIQSSAEKNSLKNDSFTRSGLVQ